MFLRDIEIPDGNPVKLGDNQVESICLGDNKIWQNTQIPSAITDFAASDGEVNQTTVTFSPATGIPNDITYNI